MPDDFPSLAHNARILQPIQLGNLTLRNRIFVPAHTTNFGKDHLPSDQHLAYHVERARGGVGAIIFESIRVQENCVGRPQGVAGFDRACIEPFSRIARAVNAEGSRLLGQIIHLGRQVDGDFERTVSWGPSDIRWSASSAMPHVMTEDDMQTVIDAHVRTALNLMEAGLDGIEVQLAHGHLLQQFLSPLSNQRDDAYGGSLENRMRFPLAVVAAVRQALGPDVCLGVRLGAEEFLPEGLHLDEAVQVAARLAEMVALDFVNVSHSAYHSSRSLAMQMADMAIDPEPFREYPASVRKTLRENGHGIPVMAVCKFRTLQEAEAALQAEQADMVGMARAHIAEPALVRKTLEGRQHEIRPCINCNQGCAGMLEKNIAIRCLVNPRTGLESLWPATTGGSQTQAASAQGQGSGSAAASPMSVIVVGGGPGGMEAAAELASRGHQVELWEASDRLGGQLKHATRLTYRKEWERLLEFQQQRLIAHNVRVRLNTEADVQSLIAAAPDAVVLASGSLLRPIDLAGGGQVFQLTEALSQPEALGLRVAFVDLTGEWSSLSAIEHLAQTHQVSVLTPGAAFAWRTTIYSTLATSYRLRELKVRILPLRKALAWDGQTLQVEDVSTGELLDLPGFDSVIVAQYNRANDGLHAPLRNAGMPVTLIGDCLAPRTAMEAIYEAAEAARRIHARHSLQTA